MTIDDLAAEVNRTVEAINGTKLTEQQTWVRDWLHLGASIPQMAGWLRLTDAQVKTIIWQIKQRVKG